MPTGRAARSLDSYRRIVALDEAFDRPRAAPEREHSRIIAGLIQALREEGTDRSLLDVLGAESAAVLPERDHLRALLTIRKPRPLATLLERNLNGLLKAEQTRRGTVQPGLLRREYKVAKIGHSDCALWRGDITKLAVDVIVNAANPGLLGCFQPLHCCIDNAIHDVGGPQLRADCARIRRVSRRDEPIGSAKATRAYMLPSRFVIHTVGPIVRGAPGELHARDLASCYRHCLDVAAELPGVRSLAFCAISTGVYGYPRLAAARVALRTVGAWLREHPGLLNLVVFNVFDPGSERAYRAALHTDLLVAR